MKSKIKYLLLFFLVVTVARSQHISLPLQNAGITGYRQQVFCFGLQEDNKSLFLKLYRLGTDMRITDSSSLALGKSRKAADFLQLTCDTLHDFLNIYLQQKDNKEVTIYRFTRNMESLATIAHVDIARLNNSSLFSHETLFYKQWVYSLKTENDSSGKQFYVNKYELKSEKENFDYSFKWQFPFERKNVASAQLFYANSRFVMLFAAVNEGPKTGQWILKLDASTGTLAKAVKLNAKTENASYFFGQVVEDRADNSLLISGQKLTANQFDPSSGKVNLAAAPHLLVYTLKVDSLCDIADKTEHKIPIVDVASGPKKTVGSFVLRMVKIARQPDGKLCIEADLFRSSGGASCFFYVNTVPLRFSLGENGLTLEKTILQQNKLIEDFYATGDKLDLNGKLCRDSSGGFERLYHKTLPFPVKLGYRVDAEGNGKWLLTKSNGAKKNVTVSVLGPQNKVYQLNQLELLSKTVNPNFVVTTTGGLWIGTQSDIGKYELKIYNW